MRTPPTMRKRIKLSAPVVVVCTVHCGSLRMHFIKRGEQRRCKVFNAFVFRFYVYSN